MDIKKDTLHPEGQPEVDIYPKTSVDQVEGLSTELDKYIEKTNYYNRVYATSRQSPLEQITIVYTVDPFGNSLAFRDENGALRAQNGDNPYALVNNTKLEKALNGKVNKLNNPWVVYATDSTGNFIARAYTRDLGRNALVWRDSTGRAGIYTPNDGDDNATDGDIVSRQYLKNRAIKYQHTLVISNNDDIAFQIDIITNSNSTPTSSEISDFLYNRPFGYMCISQSGDIVVVSYGGSGAIEYGTNLITLPWTTLTISSSKVIEV